MLISLLFDCNMSAYEGL